MRFRRLAGGADNTCQCSNEVRNTVRGAEPVLLSDDSKEQGTVRDTWWAVGGRPGELQTYPAVGTSRRSSSGKNSWLHSCTDSLLQAPKRTKRMKREKRDSAVIATREIERTRQRSCVKSKPVGKTRDITRKAEVAQRRRSDKDKIRHRLSRAVLKNKELANELKTQKLQIQQLVDNPEITDEQMLDRFQDYAASRLMDSSTAWSITGYRCFRDLVCATGTTLAKVGTGFGKLASLFTLSCSI